MNKYFLKSLYAKLIEAEKELETLKEQKDFPSERASNHHQIYSANAIERISELNNIIDNYFIFHLEK